MVRMPEFSVSPYTMYILVFGKISFNVKTSSSFIGAPLITKVNNASVFVSGSSDKLRKSKCTANVGKKLNVI